MATSDNTTLKRCSKCGHEKPSTPQYFYRDKNRSTGLTPRCIDCHKEYTRNTVEQRAASTKLYRDKNRDELRAYGRAKYAADPEGMRKRAADYRAANPEVVRATNRRTINKRRDNPEYKRKKSEYFKVYQKQNADRYRALTRSRRDRLRGSGDGFTPKDVEVIRQGQIDAKGVLNCWWCERPIKGTPHIDHVIPLALGGLNEPQNLVLSCARCNFKKNAKHPHELGRLL